VDSAGAAAVPGVARFARVASFVLAPPHPAAKIVIESTPTFTSRIPQPPLSFCWCKQFASG
jgi:hypothetical protein